MESDVLQQLRDQFDGGHKLKALIAVEALGPLAQPLVPALLTWLGDDDPIIRMVVARALGRTGDKGREVVESLTEALKDPEDAVRAVAAVALCRIGGTSVARSAVWELAQCPDGVVRLDMAAAIGRYYGRKELASEILAEALEAADPMTRQYAASLLAELDALPCASVRRLAEALQSPDWLVRFSVTEALGRAGAAAGTTVPLLQKIRDGDAEQTVRQAAEAALAKIRGG